MGVGGCGKTTFGRALARHTGMDFLDGDDYHSAASIEKMSSGTALDDRDREPWLRELNALARVSDGTAVIGCSALKRRYRDILRANTSARFIHLSVSEELARTRLNARDGHFFPASLVDSQFDALEPLEPDEPGITLEGASPMPGLITAAMTYLTGQYPAMRVATTTDGAST